MKKFSLIILLSLVFLSGCSGNERLTEMTVVQATGIDCENGEVKVSLQYLDIDKGTGTNEGVKGNITAIVEGRRNSIENALSSAEKTLPDRLYFAQNKLIILGADTEDKMKDELKEYLKDNTRCRPDTLIVKSETSAEDIIKNTQRGARVPAESICRQLKRENAMFTVNDYLNDFKENELPLITQKGKSTVVHK